MRYNGKEITRRYNKQLEEMCLQLLVTIIERLKRMNKPYGLHGTQHLKSYMKKFMKPF